MIGVDASHAKALVNTTVAARELRLMQAAEGGDLRSSDASPASSPQNHHKPPARNANAFVLTSPRTVEAKLLEVSSSSVPRGQSSPTRAPAQGATTQARALARGLAQLRRSCSPEGRRGATVRKIGQGAPESGLFLELDMQAGEIIGREVAFADALSAHVTQSLETEARVSPRWVRVIAFQSNPLRAQVSFGPSDSCGGKGGGISRSEAGMRLCAQVEQPSSPFIMGEIGSLIRAAEFVTPYQEQAVVARRGGTHFNPNLPGHPESPKPDEGQYREEAAQMREAEAQGDDQFDRDLAGHHEATVADQPMCVQDLDRDDEDVLSAAWESAVSTIGLNLKSYTRSPLRNSTSHGNPRETHGFGGGHVGLRYPSPRSPEEEWMRQREEEAKARKEEEVEKECLKEGERARMEEKRPQREAEEEWARLDQERLQREAEEEILRRRLEQERLRREAEDETLRQEEAEWARLEEERLRREAEEKFRKEEEECKMQTFLIQLQKEEDDRARLRQERLQRQVEKERLRREEEKQVSEEARARLEEERRQREAEQERLRREEEARARLEEEDGVSICAVKARKWLDEAETSIRVAARTASESASPTRIECPDKNAENALVYIGGILDQQRRMMQRESEREKLMEDTMRIAGDGRATELVRLRARALDRGQEKRAEEAAGQLKLARLEEKDRNQRELEGSLEADKRMTTLHVLHHQQLLEQERMRKELEMRRAELREWERSRLSAPVVQQERQTAQEHLGDERKPIQGFGQLQFGELQKERSLGLGHPARLFHEQAGLRRSLGSIEASDGSPALNANEHGGTRKRSEGEDQSLANITVAFGNLGHALGPERGSRALGTISRLFVHLASPGETARDGTATTLAQKQVDLYNLCEGTLIPPCFPLQPSDAANQSGFASPGAGMATLCSQALPGAGENGDGFEMAMHHGRADCEEESEDEPFYTPLDSPAFSCSQGSNSDGRQEEIELFVL